MRMVWRAGVLKDEQRRPSEPALSAGKGRRVPAYCLAITSGPLTPGPSPARGEGSKSCIFSPRPLRERVARSAG